MNAALIHHPIRRSPGFLNRIGKVTSFASADCLQNFSVFLNHDLLYRTLLVTKKNRSAGWPVTCQGPPQIVVNDNLNVESKSVCQLRSIKAVEA